MSTSPPFKVIDDSIGQFLAMDATTYQCTCMKIPWICVEIGMGFDLSEEIFLGSDDPLVKGY